MFYTYLWAFRCRLPRMSLPFLFRLPQTLQQDYIATTLTMTYNYQSPTSAGAPTNIAGAFELSVRTISTETNNDSIEGTQTSQNLPLRLRPLSSEPQATRYDLSDPVTAQCLALACKPLYVPTKDFEMLRPNKHDHTTGKLQKEGS